MDAQRRAGFFCSASVEKSRCLSTTGSVITRCVSGGPRTTKKRARLVRAPAMSDVLKRRAGSGPSGSPELRQRTAERAVRRVVLRRRTFAVRVQAPRTAAGQCQEKEYPAVNGRELAVVLDRQYAGRRVRHEICHGHFTRQDEG